MSGVPASGATGVPEERPGQTAATGRPASALLNLLPDLAELTDPDQLRQVALDLGAQLNEALNREAQFTARTTALAHTWEAQSRQSTDPDLAAMLRQHAGAVAARPGETAVARSSVHALAVRLHARSKGQTPSVSSALLRASGELLTLLNPTLLSSGQEQHADQQGNPDQHPHWWHRTERQPYVERGRAEHGGELMLLCQHQRSGVWRLFGVRDVEGRTLLPNTRLYPQGGAETT